MRDNSAVPSEIERLYREHRAGLVRLVERELHDHLDAEDVVQTAFLDAQRALERGTIPHNPHAWLAAIALNAGRRLRRRRLNAEPLEEYAVHEASGVPGIRTALATLPREQRTAVVYRDLLGFSYDETANQMGTSVGAVTMLLHRGRKRLRQVLGVTTGGLWLGRWLRRAGTQQVAVAKGTAAAFVAAGLATSGVVAARAVAQRTTAAAAPATRSGTGAAVAAPAPARLPAHRAAHRRLGSAAGSAARQVLAPSQAAAVPAATVVAQSAPASTLTSPAITLPALAIPAVPTVAVTVETPVATVTVATPTGTTATVTTPLVTVTLPIP